MDLIPIANDLVFNYVFTISVYFSIPLLTTLAIIRITKEISK